MVISPRVISTKVAVIPARYGSTRFPGKPLVLLCHKPMIQWTYEQVLRAKTIDEVVVATDDDRIADCCRAFGGKVVITSASCPNGTSRCEEAVSLLEGQYDIVVNVQGDEPLIEPEIIDGVVQCLLNTNDVVYSTACTPFKVKEEAMLTNRVKILLDRNGYVMYSSRGLIPHNKEGCVRDFPPPFQQGAYMLHVGIHCYRRHFLDTYCRLEPTPCMLMEDLEHLKVLEHGYRMKCVVVDESPHGVDLPEDVALVENLIHRYKEEHGL